MADIRLVPEMNLTVKQDTSRIKELIKIAIRNNKPYIEINGGKDNKIVFIIDQ